MQRAVAATMASAKSTMMRSEGEPAAESAVAAEPEAVRNAVR